MRIFVYFLLNKNWYLAFEVFPYITLTPHVRHGDVTVV